MLLFSQRKAFMAQLWDVGHSTAEYVGNGKADMEEEDTIDYQTGDTDCGLVDGEKENSAGDVTEDAHPLFFFFRIETLKQQDRMFMRITS